MIEIKNKKMKTPETEPHIGIEKDNRSAVSQILNTILADQHVLYIKTRNFHWNLIGGRFHSLHEHFEELYTGLASTIDQTAERIRMVGGVAAGSMHEFINNAGLKEEVGEVLEGDDALHKLLSDHEKMIQTLRNYIEIIEVENNDVGTADFLTGILQNHEMIAWMLRSYLQYTNPSTAQ